MFRTLLILFLFSVSCAHQIKKSISEESLFAERSLAASRTSSDADVLTNIKNRSEMALKAKVSGRLAVKIVGWPAVNLRTECTLYRNGYVIIESSEGDILAVKEPSLDRDSGELSFRRNRVSTIIDLVEAIHPYYKNPKRIDQPRMLRSFEAEVDAPGPQIRYFYEFAYKNKKGENVSVIHLFREHDDFKEIMIPSPSTKPLVIAINEECAR